MKKSNNIDELTGLLYTAVVAVLAFWSTVSIGRLVESMVNA